MCFVDFKKTLDYTYHDKVWVTMHLIDLMAELYRKQLAKVKVTGTLSSLERSTTRLCPLSVLVQHHSGDGDAGNPRWISRWTTNFWAHMITNFRYADDIILLATSEAELQELVDRLDRVSLKYSLLTRPM